MSVHDEGTGSFSARVGHAGRGQDSPAVSGCSISNNKGFWQQQESLCLDLAAGKHLLELAPGDPGNVITISAFPQPPVQGEVAQEFWPEPRCREPVQK